jgi:hypothetical protein
VPAAPCWPPAAAETARQQAPVPRVSSKQTKKFFGSNRNKPKHNLFWLIFGLFRKTKNLLFRFVSVCFGVSNMLQNNRKKQICFEINKKNENLLKR